ncbi:MAG: type II toxin-antitoxin system RelE/ParE family toxin [Lachnospiraceae bacterium]|nr:type II toxin-antitoxin system RelE/ParE family toxin [Lachnospiraceae bacterium]
MSYKVLRTDTADVLIRRIVLFVAEKFGNDIAIKYLNNLEQSISELTRNPFHGDEPRYPVLKRQGYRVLTLEKDLVFYKVNVEKKLVIIYAVVDQRQDYMSILRGL